jgi:hypothetical protein
MVLGRGVQLARPIDRLPSRLGRVLGALRRLNPQGDGERHRRAPARLALDADPPAVQLDDLLGQRQPNPGSFVATIGRRVHLRKALEQLRQIVVRDPDPGVFHLDPKLAGVGQSPADLHAPARRREFQRVEHEVQHHFFQAVLVEIRSGRRRGDLPARQREAFFLRHGSDRREQPPEERGQVPRAVAERHPPGVELRQIQQGVDLARSRSAF